MRFPKIFGSCTYCTWMTIAVVVVVAFFAILAWLQPAPNRPYIQINGTKVKVELAKTSSEQAKGLSSREFLAENSGMLFDFRSNPTTPAFWMHDMKFSIDIIWISEGKVVGIEKNVPPPAPETPAQDLPRYSPSTNVDLVLETPAGWASEHNIQTGNEVKLLE